jgi:hypothetical protein
MPKRATENMGASGKHDHTAAALLTSMTKKEKVAEPNKKFINNKSLVYSRAPNQYFLCRI